MPQDPLQRHDSCFIPQIQKFKVLINPNIQLQDKYLGQFTLLTFRLKVWNDGHAFGVGFGGWHLF